MNPQHIVVTCLSLLAPLWLVSADSRASSEDELTERWDKVCARLERSSAIDSIERLARVRTELDAAREAALDLIFDEDTYFYPYNGPGASGDYRKAQERVDELLAVVLEVWESGREQKLPKSLREALAEIDDCRALAAEAELVLEWPEDVPTWVDGLPRGLKKMGLRDFAWDQREARALVRNRAVLELNETRWKQDDGELAGKEAAEQVRITNEYRQMLGRSALAWSPKLQQCANLHSKYMSDTGNFGHFEQDVPEHRAPMDRARVFGYTAIVTENVSLSAGDALTAHERWKRSSGHHRNILFDEHREMASSVVGRYWTQNFGTGNGFEEELAEWFD